MENTKKITIVHFNIGRGGHFNNGGHKTYKGVNNLEYCINNNRRDVFIYPEYYHETLKKISNYSNLKELFEQCWENENFAPFEEKTGIIVGENCYFDSNGNHIISCEDVELGVGCIDWDSEYDTDVCKHIVDCSEEELELILKNGDELLIDEYFNFHLKNINWKDFDNNYESLINEYFSEYGFDIQNHYVKSHEQN
jgi:hypothetical protein